MYDITKNTLNKEQKIKKCPIGHFLFIKYNYFSTDVTSISATLPLLSTLP